MPSIADSNDGIGQSSAGGGAAAVSRAEFKRIMTGEGRVELQQDVLPLGVPEEAR